MDIWAWVGRTGEALVEAGQGRLAELMELIPDLVTDGEHERLDAVMPEALALARQVKNPWIEVYLRHWDLQSRVLQRYEIEQGLPDAVALIERASRADARDCPQSVCATQDLASCYGNADGPGFARERLAVAEETLARIDAAWPCFTCISGEYATALIDSGQPEEALRFVRRQVGELLRVGEGARAHDLCGPEIDALLLLGRAEEARAVNQAAKDAFPSEHFQEFRRIDEARILARTGALSAAVEVLPPFARVIRTPSHFEGWADAAFVLASAGALANDAKLFGQLDRLRRELAQKGVPRRSLTIALWQGRLAVLRGRRAGAERALGGARRCLGVLRAPLGADRLIDELARAIAALPPGDTPLPPSPEALLGGEAGEGAADAELEWERLCAALERWPDHPALVVACGRVEGALFGPEEATARLAGFVERAPGAVEAWIELLDLLAERAAGPELERAANQALRSGDPEVTARARWVQGRAYAARGALPEAAECFRALLVHPPSAARARLRLAGCLRDLGDPQAVLTLLLPREDGEPRAFEWERMVSASLLGRWEEAREAARHAGFELEGEGPIDEEGEVVILEVPPEGGERLAYYAVRTGPVSARVVEVAHPAQKQHLGDHYVLDPFSAAEEGEGERRLLRYRAVGRIAAGHYRAFALDGARPEDQALERLRALIESLGGRLARRSDERYQIPGEREPVPGWYGFIALPAALEPREIHALLLELAQARPPLVWPELARAAGDPAVADAQEELVERYGLL